MMPAIKKAFPLLCDYIVELSTKNDASKNKKGSNDKEWLEESEAKLLKQVFNEKRANILMSRKKKQMIKN